MVINPWLDVMRRRRNTQAAERRTSVIVPDVSVASARRPGTSINQRLCYSDTPDPEQDFPLQLKRPRGPPDETPHAHAPPPQQTAHTHTHSHALPRSHLSQPHPVSHLTHTHLSQASPASSLDSPATPTTGDTHLAVRRAAAAAVPHHQTAPDGPRSGPRPGRRHRRVRAVHTDVVLRHPGLLATRPFFIDISRFILV
ncbi:RNA-binding protein 33-like [Perca fluviatilis]|uniref:RNA-binding protein 33-like n=1 Tax=Perca fluviatilis TaxID=8168 RepID=UPI001964C7E8|nr:RNA-binding protein 33-like [Perca fluviatilis]XP_039636217.1 RNA-binding protein 33-like [Perca fluviatilis]XP_039636218.1 RNA-binding protein 33-like [Perca fluviatilis]XP_039636219.1 RNA-binding protein 33-like [Perca fluviatilis]XP_039636220.1 RNA-binding protein 33-like [Perca fluviatilis]